SAHRPARQPPGGPSVTRALPTESRTPRADDLHGAPWLPFNQLPSGGTGALLNPTATERSDSPDSLGDPQLSQVALDNLTPVVHVDQPRDGVQQCAPLNGRQGTVSRVGQQHIQVVSCRVRQLPLVSIERRRPESSRRGELPIVFDDVTTGLETQAR